MKTLPTTLILPFLTACLSYGQDAPKPVMRDAATHDQLASQLGRLQAQDPIKKFTPSQGKDPSVENQPGDLLSRSDMLCFNGLATLVPKEAILVIPPRYADRVGMRSGAKIVTWQDFYIANRGWITTQEISLAQAEGKVALAEPVTEKLAKSSNVVVATLQGGPISKLAPKPEPAPQPGQAPQKPATPSVR